MPFVKSGWAEVSIEYVRPKVATPTCAPCEVKTTTEELTYYIAKNPHYAHKHENKALGTLYYKLDHLGYTVDTQEQNKLEC